MLIRPDCGSVSNDLDPISLPGCTTVCLDVVCTGATDLEVRYELLPGIVTFADGSMSQGPFPINCSGTCRVCRRLCFKGGPVQSIAVRIVVRDVATGREMSCTSNIQVTP